MQALPPRLAGLRAVTGKIIDDLSEVGGLKPASPLTLPPPYPDNHCVNLQTVDHPNLK